MELISPTEYVKQKLLSVQEYALLSVQAVANLFRRPRYFADMTQQADLIGFGSLPIVLAACFFTGAALALNSAATLKRFGALTLIGQLVSIGIIRELGPVLAGLVVAGRNSSGMASELGSMKVTEQIDAMRALGTDPTKKLVTPRVVSSVIMLFFLTIISDLVGLTGGWVVSTFMLGLAVVLEQRLADPGFFRRLHGAGQACGFWLYRCDDWLLLRVIDQRWDPGRGTSHHRGSGGCHDSHHRSGRFRYPIPYDRARDLTDGDTDVANRAQDNRA